LGTGAKGFWAGNLGLGTGAEGLRISIVGLGIDSKDFAAGIDGLCGSPKGLQKGTVGRFFRAGSGMACLIYLQLDYLDDNFTMKNFYHM
jgi:hypothetical protein